MIPKTTLFLRNKWQLFYLENSIDVRVAIVP
jgi:hypothetical protein